MESKPNPKTFAVFGHLDGIEAARTLESQSHSVILLPKPVVATVKFEKGVAEKLKRLHEFDWIVFVDRLAANHFFIAAHGAGLPALNLDELRICAVGESVVRELRKRFVHSDLICHSREPARIIGSIMNYSGDDKGNRTLIISGNDARPAFESFSAGSVYIETIPVYDLAFDPSGEPGKTLALINGGAVDSILFCSVDDVLAYGKLVSGRIGADVIADTQFFSTDADTHEGAAVLGISSRLFRP
jgi:uroporphyrinogen-III synthase